MAQKTDEQLNAQATEIKNEDQRHANTALRIGTHLQDVVDSKANNSELNKAKDETPVEAEASTITTDLGETNDIVFTAKTKGVAGDGISVKYQLAPEIMVNNGVDDLFQIVLLPSAVDATTIPTLTITQGGDGGGAGTPFSVDVIDESEITVTLGHDGTEPIPLTVSELQTELNNFNGGNNMFVDGDYVFIIQTNMEDEVVPEVIATSMDSVEAIAVDGTNININLETTTGTITSDVDSIIALIEGDTDADELISAVAFEADDQAIDNTGEWILTGGVDGTVAEKGKMLFDTDYLYVAVDDCTISESNFKKIELVAMS